MADHSKALKPQLMSREERVARVNKYADKVKNSKSGQWQSKLFDEDDTSIKDTVYMWQHGNNLEKKLGRPLGYASKEDLINELTEMFLYCDEKQMLPKKTTMSLWLGITFETLDEWTNNPMHPYSEVLKKATGICNEMMLNKAAEGRLSPILYFFIAKNWYGMQDKTEIQHTTTRARMIDLDEQDRIINATPGIVIDAQYREVQRRSEDSSRNTRVLENNAQNANFERIEDASSPTQALEDLLVGAEDSQPEDFGTQKTFAAEDFQTHKKPEDFASGKEDFQTEDFATDVSPWEDDL